MTPDDLEQRAKQFALRVIKLVDALPPTPAGRAMGQQLVRCGMSAAANYRAARRARSRREFIAKLSIVVEEADEAAFWLEMVQDAELLPPKKMALLRQESDELMRIFAKSRLTAARSPDRSKPPHTDESP